jgi:hypothetical protein
MAERAAADAAHEAALEADRQLNAPVIEASQQLEHESATLRRLANRSLSSPWDSERLKTEKAFTWGNLRKARNWVNKELERTKVGALKRKLRKADDPELTALMEYGFAWRAYSEAFCDNNMFRHAGLFTHGAVSP